LVAERLLETGGGSGVAASLVCDRLDRGSSRSSEAQGERAII
jgi:hypothetical protein